MGFLLLNHDEMGLIGITDGAPPVIREVLNPRPGFDAEEGIAMVGIIFKSMTDITTVFYHTIAAVDGEIFSFEMINWFEIAGLTGCRASEAPGRGPDTKGIPAQSRPVLFVFFQPGAQLPGASLMM